MGDKKRAVVNVLRAGPNGRPQAQISVDAAVSSSQLGGLISKVVTNERVLGLAGLAACLGCKSGLDIHIIDQPDPVQFEV